MAESIFVRTFDDSTISVSVSPDTSVLELKKTISDQLNLLEEDYLISFEGSILEDNKLLSDYDISRNTTFHLIPTLPGGRVFKINPNLVKIAAKYRWERRICRRCYARLPARATQCRKKKCRSRNIREKAELKVHKP
ncbi:unnamed protein product [Enterobius vermicularis]|uniref:Ubiquitin-ribosomal protein eL40 fusion protein n=1 Tax=Enterobius vermicularis TaxID=51028 RepID=A0A0N4USG9_ENTVE|nr:unnamed protein product [Enterobius vermicularis]